MMTDLDLFTIGCAVSFISICGAYSFLRERFNAQAEAETKQPEPVPARQES